MNKSQQILSTFFGTQRLYISVKSPPYDYKSLNLFSVLFILQQSSACQPINLLEQRHVLPQTPIEQPTPNLPGVSTDVEICFVG